MAMTSCGSDLRRVLVVRRNASAAALVRVWAADAPGTRGGLHEERAAIASGAGLDEHGHALLGEELDLLALKLHLGAEFRRVEAPHPGLLRCRRRQRAALRRRRSGPAFAAAAVAGPPPRRPRAAGSAASASASSSESVLRAASGSKCAATSRIGLVRTIAPLSLPLNRAKSASVLASK